MTDHDRDRSIDLLLRSHRTDDAAPLSPDCLNAETLSAWMEGALPQPARASAERHAAGCVRCQALLAAMARTDPEVATRPWWSTLTAKWLVPIGAIATALIVWVSVERTRPSTMPTSTPQATAARDEAASRPLPSVSVGPPAATLPRHDRQTQVGQQPPVAPDVRTKPETVGGVSAGSREAALEPVSPPPAGNVVGGTTARTLDALQPQDRAAADTRAKLASPSPVAAAPPPPPAAPAPSAPTTASDSRRAVPQLEQNAAAPKRMAEGASAAARAPAESFGGGGGRAFIAPVEIRSPDSQYRWRIMPPMGIQRTTDDGATWAVVDPIVAANAESRSAFALVAGSSPARDVCWIVGRAGLVLLSTDGATWQRRSLPQAVDLTAVRATDAATAIVTAADGRRFATIDGGVTWTPMK